MQNLSLITRGLGMGLVLGLAGFSGSAAAQDTQDLNDSRNKPPCATPASVTLDYVEYEVLDLVKYMAETSCRNLILGGDDLKGKVTIISHKPVPYWTAFSAMESALATAGYTMVEVGGAYKVIPTSKASQAPVAVYEGSAIPATDRVVTQIFQMENTSVSDISSIAKELAGPQAKIIAYVPTNTLIITDSAYSIRRMWKVVGQLDVESPKSSIHVVNLNYATASEVKTIIEQVYGTSGDSASASSSKTSTKSTSSSRRSRRNRAKAEAADASASASSVGAQGKYIEKIVADERTNRLIILANDEAMEAVRKLLLEVDVDVDPANRAQIHVVYLEHADATEVATTLSNLSEGGNTNSRTPTRTNTRTSRASRNNPTDDADGSGSATSVTALLDDGVRITADENTNSLVIVASPEAFRILQQVINKLDIRRKQVFVEVVIMEMASEDTMDLGMSYHTGIPGDSATGIVSSQVGPSSLGLSTDLLSGVAMGVYGDSISIDTQAGPLVIPAFGVVVSALQANSSVNILSTPNIMTLDNEEAEIVVGRNVPFPTSQGRDSNNNPIISFQREDVAITLKVTPQINESDYVTMEVYQEVTEIEESAASGSDLVASGGPTTSKRTADTTVLVKDNQTVVIGGLMSTTETEVETKVPILGDLPLVGVLFRSKSTTTRKTNLLIFLTPHVIDTPEDLQEVYEVKVAQREEFLRRFYGKSEVEQMQALDELLSYSMNVIDQPSRYRTKIDNGTPEDTLIDNGEEPATELVQDPDGQGPEEPTAPDELDPDTTPEGL
ncbi:MAG: general secretion pathway protein D [Cognaticolwellia sp.]